MNARRYHAAERHQEEPASQRSEARRAVNAWRQPPKPAQAKRRRTDQPDAFDQARADLGPFWLLWMAGYVAFVVLSAWVSLDLIKALSHWIGIRI